MSDSVQGAGSLYSTHTFILPFVFNQGSVPASDFQSPNWQRLSDTGSDLPYLSALVDSDNEGAEVVRNRVNYAYARYFNSEAKEINYRNSDLVQNYRYKNGENSLYRITYNEEHTLKVYQLPINYIFLRYLPKLNAGFLVISTSNYEYRSLEDCKKINQYGRRIYNPFLSSNLDFAEAPNNLEIIPQKEADRPTEKTKYLESYSIMDAPRKLLGDFFGLSEEAIFPEVNTKGPSIDVIIDDRMFVHSYITVEKEFSPQDKEAGNAKRGLVRKTSSWGSLTKKELQELYAIAYIDKADASCTSQAMLKELVKVASYTRWSGYGNLYLTTQHSFVFLSDTSSFPDFLIHNFQSEYLEMVLLVLSQRVGILKYSKDAGDSVSKGAAELLQLQEAYVTFKNQYMLPEISAQEQAVELYALLQDALYISKYFHPLDNQVTSLHEIGQTKEAARQRIADEKLNKELYILTIIAALPILSEFIVLILSVLVHKFHIEITSTSILSDKLKFLSYILSIGVVLYVYHYRAKKKEK
ncbi:TPA: hypothetical protein U0K61_000746 [Streptococcus suis]|nr:hypothetical protein [Streptococcus suis]